ncbi:MULTISPECIES: hypothetical protein [unclassified Ruegeria]|uniref:hypothetical protein n=1 Tax=unclassified Ruegeria TaxID=2625375 RepID=UPI00148776D9|nr:MULTISPECIES: hypothetical protein [unclassified Ruegeria]
MSRKFFFTSVMMLLLLGTHARTEVVAISTKNGVGHGFLFSVGSKCYIFLPDHVLGRSSSFSFQAPTASSHEGKAKLIQSKPRSMDLAIAEVTSKTFDGCGTSWNVIVSWEQPKQPIGFEINLRQVPNPGQQSEIPMRVNRTLTDEFDARVTEKTNSNAVMEGTSGSIAFHDGQAIGMAISATDQWQATFLSLTAITQAVGSVLDLPIEPVKAGDNEPFGPSPKSNSDAAQHVDHYEDVILKPILIPVPEENE